MSPKKIFIVAGEASGDLHGAHLIRELKQSIPDLEVRALGGEQMAAEGAHLVHDLTKEAVLGVGDVLKKYFVFKGIFEKGLKDVASFKPDAVILIDSPGFNLRFAKRINKRFPVIYYVSPQIWAWGMRRIHHIRKYISHMMVFFQFEKTMYEKAGVPCTWIGHPLVGHVKPTKSRSELRGELIPNEDTKAVALFPGSRKTEVERILPEMFHTAQLLQKEAPNTLFLLGESSTLPSGLYDEVIAEHGQGLNLKRERNRVYDLFYASDFAMVTSGTATLEAALTSVPFVIFYKTAWSTFFLARFLIQIPFIGLVNVVAGRKIVPEFIQTEIHPETIAHEAKYLLNHRDLREKMILDLKDLQNKLGPEGAANRAAEAVLKVLGSDSPVLIQ